MKTFLFRLILNRLKTKLRLQERQISQQNARLRRLMRDEVKHIKDLRTAEQTIKAQRLVIEALRVSDDPKDKPLNQRDVDNMLGYDRAGNPLAPVDLNKFRGKS